MSDEQLDRIERRLTNLTKVMADADEFTSEKLDSMEDSLSLLANQVKALVGSFSTALTMLKDHGADAREFEYLQSRLNTYK